MRKAKLSLVIAIFAFVPFVTGAAQADTCPAKATCYEGHELEFDPKDGPVQFLVVRTDTTVTSTLDGQTTSETATLVEFASNGDTFAQRGEPLTYAKTGALKTADVGDTFVLTEVE